MFYLFVASFFRVFFLVMAPDNAMKTTNAPTAEAHIFFNAFFTLRIFNFICGSTNKIQPGIDKVSFEGRLIFLILLFRCKTLQGFKHLPYH